MTIQKILLGTDFSEEAHVALDHALNIGRRVDAEVVLVHACTVPDTGEGRGIEGRMAEHLREILAENRTKLEELRERHAGQGARVSHMVKSGFADNGVVAAADEIDADLIVVGTHGRTGFKRFLLGSVAERVVRTSGRSVLVVRNTGSGAGGYKRILVPTDFSVTAERAIETALDVVAPEGTIVLFNAWQLPGPAVGAWGPAVTDGPILKPLRDELGQVSEQNLAKLRDRYSPRHANIEIANIEDAPTHGVQAHMSKAETPYDLVVIGSHGRRGVSRWMLGSVAENVVRYAPCSVLVVHDPKAKKPEED